MSRHRDMVLECKVYVGDLPRDATEREIEKAFSPCGTIRKVWVARNPPGFAFVEFDDPRDAEDAVRDLDGRSICGVKARVEHSSGKVRPKPWLRGSRGAPPPRSRPFDPSDRCYQCGERGHYAYDCRRLGGRRRSRSRSRGRKRSRSRSRGRYSRSRSRSRSYSRGRSRSRSRGRYSRSPTPRRGRDKSYSRSRSRSPRNDSPVENGE